jgi:hypothetical protein
MVAQEWRLTAPGFAVGPEKVLGGLDGVRVVLSAYWTDEDGVCVSVDAGDAPIPGPLAESVAVHLIQLAALPAPVLSDLAAA